MNQKQFDDLVATIRSQTMDLLQSKGVEYAGSEDRLANFKRNAILSGVAPMTVLHVYMAKHWDAFSNYVRETQKGNKVVLSEPITGRLADLINYAILAWALETEATPTGPQPVPIVTTELQEIGDMVHIRSVEGRVARITGSAEVAHFLRGAMMTEGPFTHQGVQISAWRFPDQEEWKVL